MVPTMPLTVSRARVAASVSLTHLFPKKNNVRLFGNSIARTNPFVHLLHSASSIASAPPASIARIGDAQYFVGAAGILATSSVLSVEDLAITVAREQ